MRRAANPDIESEDDFDTEFFEAEFGFTPDDFEIPAHAFESAHDYDYDAQQAADAATQSEWADADDTPQNWHGEQPEPPDDDSPLDHAESAHLSKDDFHPDVARHSHMVKVNNDPPDN